ncbi:MAG: transposase [Candidatus Omnitrophica bacterium]|jgi:REP element-mobilizing transposase RayT|nr:transposase [Candidatus Omnitrophota bacterium]MDD5660999.1 transposase [Candidatus Omnitrophota bacterium]
MGRVKRVYFVRGVYHICIRGNNRQMILREEQDKAAFLETLNKYKKRFGFKLYGFVIMDNHAHLVLETDNNNNISRVMQAITLSYSQKFRNKYYYTGYVWQGRFKSQVIDGDNYILGCLNYIHNNPVRAGIVYEAKDYFWSSYHSHANEDSALKNMVTVDTLKF